MSRDMKLVCVGWIIGLWGWLAYEIASSFYVINNMSWYIGG